MPSLNKVMLMGHMTRNAEMRFTPSGNAVTNFSLATNWGSGDRKTTEFHNCVIWSTERAERAQWASKLLQGDLVYVEGRITTRTWKAQDGSERKTTEIVCDRADLLRNKLETNPNKIEVEEDDIPF